ncbi:MAG: UvrD-helicase domain-containing protein [Gemmatimonadetes bacterium]|nr:UvrD-helicase domain-containing protein [Gemmatimonadota bacterium]
MLVVAGPGAGKTFCLIGRVGHLIARLGFAPARICAVTFTNKAAEEITARLHKSLGAPAEEIKRGTLHALCLELLREHAEAAGLQRGFGVADDAYQRTVVRRLGVPKKRGGSLLLLFGRRRLQDYALTAGDERLYREYAAHLVKRNLLDFDDLLARTAELFRRRPDVARQVAARWDYLLVDEFQDLNNVQYEILQQLAAPHRNFFAVGDDEQSIFSWTGAHPEVLKRFSLDYGIPQPIVLDKNCRCSHQIFETARRLVSGNRRLFDKQLTAERESAHEVCAVVFADEDAEAAWLLEDIRADRTAAGTGWGDYAVLYRYHEAGNHLEGRLLRAGIPCRLARGRAIVEDDVVGYVIAALRVMGDPGDAAAVETFARLVFSPDLMQEIETESVVTGGDVLAAARALARRRPRGDPDARKLWRFVYQVENLTALGQSRHSLPALVEELLSQSVGPYRNVLEEHHDELTDPAEWPDAERLAALLREALAAGRRVWIEPQQGLEFALWRMLTETGFRLVSYFDPAAPPGEGALVLRGVDGGTAGLALTLFKALQLVHAGDLDGGLRSYVTFDLETTDRDPAACEIVEIGAVKVVEGEIVERFHSLVRPGRPVSPAARNVHGYGDDDLRDAPPFADVWPRFRAFVGRHTLLAHNGQRFDLPVLRRLAAGLPGVDNLVCFDTLPLAHSLFQDSAKLVDLAARFGIEPGRAHHALDDAVTLAHVTRALGLPRALRARKAALVNLLDYLGLALALDPGHYVTDEHALLAKLCRPYALGRFSDCLEFYEAERASTGAPSPGVEEVIERLGGQRLREKLAAEPDPEQRYPAALARLRALMDADPGTPLPDAIARLLERVALSTSREAEIDPSRVNLLTLHSTKGLEFSRVYVVGVEDDQLPGWKPLRDGRDDEIQEARRLLYVGMTRARDRLILTRVDQRSGRPAGGSRFLEEMGLTPVRKA